MIKALFIAVLMVVLSGAVASAGHLQKEKFYQDEWCDKVGGIKEYRLDDGTRVDCLTDQYAIEFDFASKWAESVGQSLYYSFKTGKRPGVVLIMEKEDDARFLARLNLLAERYGIKVWQIQ